MKGLKNMHDIKELYKTAGEFHGHYCPGLAIGVRAAYEACDLLGINEHGHKLHCIAESKACYMDGFQIVLGTTWGNGGLELRDRGKTAFDVYDLETGKSVRICAVSWPQGMSKDETIEFILTAPLEQVFSTGEAHFDYKEGPFSRRGKQKCQLCGEECSEDFMRIRDGKAICLDCFEKN